MSIYDGEVYDAATGKITYLSRLGSFKDRDLFDRGGGVAFDVSKGEIVFLSFADTINAPIFMKPVPNMNKSYHITSLYSPVAMIRGRFICLD